jgi:hypothetical protein
MRQGEALVHGKDRMVRLAAVPVVLVIKLPQMVVEVAEELIQMAAMVA